MARNYMDIEAEIYMDIEAEINSLTKSDIKVVDPVSNQQHFYGSCSNSIKEWNYLWRRTEIESQIRERQDEINEQRLKIDNEICLTNYLNSLNS